MVNLFEFDSSSKVHLSLKADSHAKRSMSRRKKHVWTGPTQHKRKYKHTYVVPVHTYFFLCLDLCLCLKCLKKLYECFARLCLDLLVVYRSVYLPYSYTSEFMPMFFFFFSFFFSTRKRTKLENTRMKRKWPPTVTRRAKH